MHGVRLSVYLPPIEEWQGLITLCYYNLSLFLLTRSLHTDSQALKVYTDVAIDLHCPVVMFVGAKVVQAENLAFNPNP